MPGACARTQCIKLGVLGGKEGCCNVVIKFWSWKSSTICVELRSASPFAEYETLRHPRQPGTGARRHTDNVLPSYPVGVY